MPGTTMAAKSQRTNKFRLRLAPGFFTSGFGLVLLGGLVTVLLVAAGFFTYFYIHFGRLIDQRLTGQIFQNTSSVYSAPGTIFTGETMRPAELTSYLLGAGYQESAAPNETGEYHVTGSTVEIRPAATSYFKGTNALRVSFAGTEISHISQIPNGNEISSAQI